MQPQAPPRDESRDKPPASRIAVDVGCQTVTVREAHADDAMGGTGGRVWSCSVLLLEYLEKSGTARGRHVVELGCGTGIVGIGLAEALGAASVVLTDMDDDSLTLARVNAAEAAERMSHDNRSSFSSSTRSSAAGATTTSGGGIVSPPHPAPSAGPTIDVCKYDWADPAACLLEQLRDVTARDVGTASRVASPPDRRPVLLVGSDLCYTRSETEVLCRAVAGLLRHPELNGDGAVFVSVCGLRDDTLLPCLLTAIHRNGLEVVEGEPMTVVSTTTPSSGGGSGSGSGSGNENAAADVVGERHPWDADAIRGGSGYVRFTLRVA